MNKAFRLTVLLSAMIFLFGCAEVALVGFGAGLGFGTYKYIESSLEREYSLAYDSAWDATNTALANLTISVSNSLNEGTKGKIEAVRRDGKKVMIKLLSRSQNATAINIRVGTLGSREDAERIHEEISAVAGLK